MATVTVDDFINDWVLPFDEVDLSINKGQKIRFINRGLSNIKSDIRRLEPETLAKYIDLNTDNNGEATLPTDRNRSDQMIFFSFSNYDDNEIISDDEYRIKGDKVKFLDNGQQTVYLEYMIDIPRVSSITDEIPVYGTQTLEKLASEVQALIYASQDQNQSTASYQNSLTQSNRIQ